MEQILEEQVQSKFLLVQQHKEIVHQPLVILDITATKESLKATLIVGEKLVEVL